mgnify:CR=1 FL=1
MRRRFNAALCPKTPPNKGDRQAFKSHIGSPFNSWFRNILSDNNIQIKAFAALIDEPYATVIGWRYKNDPHCWGMCRIARGLESLGLGEYQEIVDKIKGLKKRRNG